MVINVKNTDNSKRKNNWLITRKNKHKGTFFIFSYEHTKMNLTICIFGNMCRKDEFVRYTIITVSTIAKCIDAL